MVLGRKKVARTSSTPGRTRSINFFNIGDRYCLVDLPGYGYAKVPQKIKASWNELIDHYLHYRKNLKGLVQIIDARHKPSDEDLMMIDWLKATEIEYIIAATKVDKLKNKDFVKQKRKLPEQLGVAAEKIIYTSAKERTGRKQVLGFIDSLI
jgi:GTP-binding protein